MPRQPNAIEVAVALSLLVHVAALWKWMPQVRMPSSEMAERRDARGPLIVQLAPPARPSLPQPLSPAPKAQRTPTLQPRPPKAAARPRPTPPVIALDQPRPSTPSPPPEVASATPPSAALPPAGDLASYIEARRRARGESAPAAASPDSASNAPLLLEDETARANRIAAANLGSDRKPIFGSDARRGGGVFTIKRIAYDYAEFVFFGWNKDIRRNTAQLIEVRKGGNSDIRIAVVRKMISIIREHEQGDFIWESTRLDRNVTLSARARDNAGLEEFMMREFFEPGRP